MCSGWLFGCIWPTHPWQWRALGQQQFWCLAKVSGNVTGPLSAEGFHWIVRKNYLQNFHKVSERNTVRYGSKISNILANTKSDLIPVWFGIYSHNCEFFITKFLNYIHISLSISIVTSYCLSIIRPFGTNKPQILIDIGAHQLVTQTRVTFGTYIIKSFFGDTQQYWH